MCSSELLKEKEKLLAIINKGSFDLSFANRFAVVL